ncbi:MAG: helix-turn-helix domain-containing protein [Phenylobacterium sp.]|nr:helix-turn-helix domain-containing protein [Phenylobacterium sp.]
MNSELECHIGRRLRARRLLVGLTQKQLAAAVGVGPQQIQKYECGATTLSADRLWSLTQALGVAPAYVFDGFDPERARRVAARPSPHHSRYASAPAPA